MPGGVDCCGIFAPVTFFTSLRVLEIPIVPEALVVTSTELRKQRALRARLDSLPVPLLGVVGLRLADQWVLWWWWY